MVGSLAFPINSEIVTDAAESDFHLRVVVHLLWELVVPIEQLACAELLAEQPIDDLLDLELGDGVLDLTAAVCAQAAPRVDLFSTGRSEFIDLVVCFLLPLNLTDFVIRLVLEHIAQPAGLKID